MESVRIDSWLWAARFFKTRTLAKTAVEGGKIHIDGSRTKPSKAVQPGQTVTITKGTEHFEVIVEGLSINLFPSIFSHTLYHLTSQILILRLHIISQRHLSLSSSSSPLLYPLTNFLRYLLLFIFFIL